MSLRSVVLLLVLGAAPATAADWPQWRGPNRDSAGDPSTATPWPPTLTRRWRSEVGTGQSSPVVAGSSVFVFTREQETEVARAIDLRTGRTLWRQAYAAPYEVYPGALSFGSGPKSTPLVSGGRVFTVGISGILSAFDVKDGRVLWRKDFAGRFPATAPPFGTSMSPLLAGGLVVVHAGGHDGGALIAFDPATGAERWTVDGDGPSYSSPIVTAFGGQEHLVIQVHRKILGLDPASGRRLWSVPFVTSCDQNIVTPLRAGDVIVVSSQHTGTRGIRPVRQGSEWVPQLVWHTDEVSMYMSSPIFVDGRVVGLSHRKKGQYFALDPANGSVQWRSEPGRGENAAFVIAHGGVLVLEGDGTLLVLPPGASSFTPSHRYQVAESATFAHPVPTDLGILVKDATGLSLHARDPRNAHNRQGGGPRLGM